MQSTGSAPAKAARTWVAHFVTQDLILDRKIETTDYTDYMDYERVMGIMAFTFRVSL